MVDLKKGMKNILQRRFYYVLNDDKNDFFCAATYLDFNYKKFSYLQDSDKSLFYISKAKIFIKSVIKENIKQSEQVQSSESQNLQSSDSQVERENSQNIPSNQYTRKASRSHSNFLNTLQDPSEKNQVDIDPLMSKLDNEFNNYENKGFIFEEKVENMRFKALEFFSNFRNELKLLSKVARILYSVPATSVPSESLFSSAGSVQTELRNRLDPSVMEMISFIKGNGYE
ncbi:unnamed protein product [Brachionus calyciflorus]|uniref:HAT C-terminal dimerisation domain-containing protein n=1 Tax=Brachionus calyciflorus TaxID=104777 RepID=A0A814DES4_9BILA|nr:unnamed protein product [Brachionus calyciflorus]